MWPFSGNVGSGFSSYSTAEEVTQGIDAAGLTAIVTGASSGIGVETARVLALRGVHVVMAVRNTAAGEEVKERIVGEIPSAKVDVMELDLSSMTSIRKFASEYKTCRFSLNLLINNAGIMGSPFMLSKDGIELQFATNHLGHFLLTHLLLDLMKESANESGIEGRIVNLSSMAYLFAYRGGICFDSLNDQSGYWSWCAYGQSKLANILHANELARRLKEDGASITANSLHPGGIPTNLFRYNWLLEGVMHTLGKYLFKSIPQGAATTCYVALHPRVKGVSGEYFNNCNLAGRMPMAKDVKLARKLWDFSMDLINAKWIWSNVS